MQDWRGNTIYSGEDVIINVGPEGDIIKDEPKEIRLYILDYLTGSAIAAN